MRKLILCFFISFAFSSFIFSSNQRQAQLERQGILFKKGDFFNRWNSRYFYLRGYQLSYSIKKEDAKLKNSIDLRKCRELKEGDSKHKQFSFILVLEDKKKEIYLSAENQSDYTSWVNSLKATIKALQEKEKSSILCEIITLQDDIECIAQLMRGEIEEQISTIKKLSGSLGNHSKRIKKATRRTRIIS